MKPHDRTSPVPLDVGDLLRALADADATGGIEQLRRAAIPRPARVWRALGLLREALPENARERIPTHVLGALADAADPEAAVLGLTRYVEAASPEALADAKRFDLLTRLMGCSPFFADHVIHHPGDLDRATDGDPTTPTVRADYAALYNDAPTDENESPAARRARALRIHRRELLRIVVRRLLGRNNDEVLLMRELSDLADATIEVALAETVHALQRRFGHPCHVNDNGEPGRRAGLCVIAMGKLGGRELNFSSDVDLLFVYSDDGRTTGCEDGSGRIGNHAFFARLAEGVLAWLADVTDEGFFYRVDARLRPDGVGSALARPRAAYEIYYETQAQLWERMALIKARHVGGDAELGRAFEAICRPLVFDPLHSADLPTHIHRMKQRIDRQVVERGDDDREVKRGVGGIREIEFFVQTLQMLHGADRGDLWQPSTLDAVAALHRAGLLERDEADALARDYLFLRVVEHRLQVAQMVQTHTLPDGADALRTLARRCGLEDGDALMRRWREVSTRVHRRYVDLFAPEEARQAAEEAAAQGDPARRAAAALMNDRDDTETTARLEPFGLAERGALKTLRRLAGLDSNLYVSADAREAFGALAPRLLEACRRTPSPTAALAGFESFVAATGAPAGQYRFLGAAPAALDLLIFTLGCGQALTQTLVAHPEFADHLAAPEIWAAAPNHNQMAHQLERWTAAHIDDDAALGDAMVRFKRLQYLMAGWGELSDLLDYEGCCLRTTWTAELIVRRALAVCAERMGLGAEPTGFAALAMGKMGAAELNHFSDLDLIFVWDKAFAADRERPAETAAALAEHVVALLTAATSEGPLYGVDARLRPEGAGAPLAPSLERYAAYFETRAETWEFQSAMRLRSVAGDERLGRRLIETLGRVIAERCRRVDLASELRAMRTRIEASVRLPRWVHCDFKKGRGGLVDLEFIAQLTQLRGLADDPDLMGRGPLDVFKRLDDAVALVDDYVWLRRLERRTRLLFDTERSALPASGEKLDALRRACRSLSDEREGDLLDVVNDLLRRNRARFDRATAQPHP